MGDKCVAVVFARALVNGEDHGVKPFLVPINDGINMHPGVVCKSVPETYSKIYSQDAHFLSLKVPSSPGRLKTHQPQLDVFSQGSRTTFGAFGNTRESQGR